jgi:hypothetical protein
MVIKLFFSIRIFSGFLATVVDVECMYKTTTNNVVITKTKRMKERERERAVEIE